MIKKLKVLLIVLGIALVGVALWCATSYIVHMSYSSRDLVVEKELGSTEESTTESSTISSIIKDDSEISKSNEDEKNDGLYNIISYIKSQDVDSLVKDLLTMEDYYKGLSDKEISGLSTLDSKDVVDMITPQLATKFDSIIFENCLELYDVVDNLTPIYVYKVGSNYGKILVVCDYKGREDSSSYSNERLHSEGDFYSLCVNKNNCVVQEKGEYLIYYIK